MKQLITPGIASWLDNLPQRFDERGQMVPLFESPEQPEGLKENNNGGLRPNGDVHEKL